MMFDPTEPNVDPFLFTARIRTMQQLVLALAIHDKNVTMAKTAQVSFIIRTGLTSPSEDRRASQTHRNNEFGITALLQSAVRHRGANPHTSSIPDKGSGSRQSAPLPQHTILTQFPAATREEKYSPLGGHQGTTIRQTELFSATVTSPTCSE